MYQLYGNKKFSLTKPKKEFHLSNLIFAIYTSFFNLINKFCLNENKLIVIDNNKSKKIKTLKDNIVFYPYTNLRYLNVFKDDFKLREQLIKNYVKKHLSTKIKCFF